MASRKVTIKLAKKAQGQSYDVTFSGLTKGEILSMQNALQEHAKSGSAVGSDVLDYLNNGLRECNEPWLKDLIPSED